MHFIFLLIIFATNFEADVNGHPYGKCRRLIDGINKRSQLSLSVEGGPTFCASSAELLCMAEDGGQITFKLCNSTRGESGECTFDCIVAMYIELKCMIVCAVQMEENVGGKQASQPEVKGGKRGKGNNQGKYLTTNFEKNVEGISRTRIASGAIGYARNLTAQFFSWGIRR